MRKKSNVRIRGGAIHMYVRVRVIYIIKDVCSFEDGQTRVDTM